MKRKRALIAAAICIGAGLLTLFTALCLTGFDLGGLDTARLERKTLELTDEIRSIEIRDSLCDVSIVPSSDDLCHVYFGENETFSYDISVENGELIIKSTDSRKWYGRIGFYIDSSYSLTVALPAYRDANVGVGLGPIGNDVNYNSLSIRTVSGHITVNRQFYFDEIALYSTSGDIRCEAQTNTLLAELNHTPLRRHAETVSGNIDLSGVDAGGSDTSVSVKSTSGDITLSDLRIDTLQVQTTSGHVEASAISVNGTARLESVSGDLELTDVSMETAFFKTVSGNIRLGLCHAMDFVTRTTSGSIKHPASSPNAGICELVTTSGDIEVYLLYADAMNQAS